MKAITLQRQNASVVVDRSAVVIAAADCTVKSHDHCNRAVDFFCTFFLVRFDIPGRVGADEDVIHHPAECRCPPCAMRCSNVSVGFGAGALVRYAQPE